jgi:tetratricopeptide (TPR) repeat protein
MNEENYIGFESYLANEMPSDEKIIFEDKLQNDSKFRESFNLYKETTQFLEHKFSSEAIDFKKNLETISNNHFSDSEEKETKVVNLRPWYYAVAATMAIVFGALLFTQSDPQYGDYNQHQTAVFVERSEADVNLKEAQEFFNAQNYKKAVQSFEKINDLKNPELQLYYAIALIETNDYQKAEIFLNNIRTGVSVYKDKATWYLALSNLKQKKLEECKTILKQIPVDAEDYDKAQQLVKDLD